VFDLLLEQVSAVSVHCAQHLSFGFGVRLRAWPGPGRHGPVASGIQVLRVRLCQCQSVSLTRSVRPIVCDAAILTASDFEPQSLRFGSSGSRDSGSPGGPRQNHSDLAEPHCKLPVAGGQNQKWPIYNDERTGNVL
jgi:hypothetical protein